MQKLVALHKPKWCFAAHYDDGDNNNNDKNNNAPQSNFQNFQTQVSNKLI